MGVVPEELQTTGGEFIKADEFLKGLALEVVGFETIVSENKKFGADEEDYLFKEGKLKKGEAFRYTFKTFEKEGEKDFFEKERTVESKSTAFFIAFSNLNPDTGNKIWITKTGSGETTRYMAVAYDGQEPTA